MPSKAAVSQPDSGADNHSAVGTAGVTMADMEQNARIGRRFGPEFVEEHRRRFGKRPPEQRQLTYDIAAGEDYASWRRWLDEQVSLLPGRAADAMARRIWLDENFWPVHFELATGAGLRAAGLAISYEQDWGGRTPDWTILSADGKPLAFVEVHTDQPPANTFSQMRAWHGLVERIKTIPVPVVLQLASKDPVRPPDAGTAKKITQDLKNKLLKDPAANIFLSNGYRFLVMADSRRGGLPAVSPLGIRASFLPPSSIAGPVSAQNLLKNVAEKARIYRDLADKYDVPLIVAVGAHKFTGVTRQDVDDLLAGLAAPKMKFQFNPGDPHIGSQTVSWAPIEPWQWPGNLAGLLLIENELPFALAVRPNPGATRSMAPEILTLARAGSRPQ